MDNDVFVYKVYIVYFIAVFLFILMLKLARINRKQTVIFLGIVLVLGLSFRGIDQGLNDTRVVYMGIFDSVENITYSDLLSSNLAKYTSVLFVWFTKFISDCSFHNFRFYIITCAMLFVIPYELFIYKKCKNVYFANLLFVAFIYPYGFYIIRQCLSIGMLLLSLCFVEEKVIRKKTFVFATISVLLHPLAGVFITLYLLMELVKKFDKLTIVNNILVVVIALILILPGAFEFIFSYLPQDSKYGIFVLQNHYLSGELWVGAFIVYLILTLIPYFRYFTERRSSEEKFLVGMSLCTLLFISTTNIMQDLVRIAYFFFPMNIVILSNDDTFRLMKMKKILKLAVTVCITFYCFGILLPQSNIIRW
ncbi:MAG: EpsG family protein [Lachnospiraceae bacterium]|nr:EpsG family protein [Lachnospiraceae bacterium]